KSYILKQIKIMEPIDWIRKIELEYPVEEIKYKDIIVWPFLRSYVRFDILRKKYNQVDLQQAKLNRKTLSVLLKNLTVGVFLLLKRKKYFVFTSSKCRIKFNDIYIDRVLGGMSKL